MSLYQRSETFSWYIIWQTWRREPSLLSLMAHLSPAKWKTWSDTPPAPKCVCGFVFNSVLLHHTWQSKYSVCRYTCALCTQSVWHMVSSHGRWKKSTSTSRSSTETCTNTKCCCSSCLWGGDCTHTNMQIHNASFVWPRVLTWCFHFSFCLRFELDLPFRDNSWQVWQRTCRLYMEPIESGEHLANRYICSKAKHHFPPKVAHPVCCTRCFYLCFPEISGGVFKQLARKHLLQELSCDGEKLTCTCFISKCI